MTVQCYDCPSDSTYSVLSSSDMVRYKGEVKKATEVHREAYRNGTEDYGTFYGFLTKSTLCIVHLQYGGCCGWVCYKRFDFCHCVATDISSFQKFRASAQMRGR